MVQTIAAVLAMLVVATSSASADDRWWREAEFTPRETAILGHPVSEFDASWSKASLLTTEDFPAAAGSALKRIHSDGFRFEYERDVNGDGSAELFAVGVYETLAGERGQFIAVLGSAKAGVREILFVSKRQLGAGSSAIYLEEDGTISWIFCLACDDAGSIKEENGRWMIEWFDDEEQG